MNLFSKEQPIPDASEEHHIVLPGLDIAINHTLKMVFVVDQTGTDDGYAMAELNKWIESKGYFLHAVTVLAPIELKEE